MATNATAAATAAAAASAASNPGRAAVSSKNREIEEKIEVPDADSEDDEVTGGDRLKSTAEEDDDREKDEDEVEESSAAPAVQFSGYVSKPTQGYGRSSTDRVFLSINKRPCEYAKVKHVSRQD